MVATAGSNIINMLETKPGANPVTGYPFQRQDIRPYTALPAYHFLCRYIPVSKRKKELAPCTVIRYIYTFNL